MHVTLIESTHLGGVCLNRGCIPTKAMLQTATVAHEVAEAARFGVMVDAPARIDYGVALARRDAVVARLRTGVRGLLKHGPVQVVTGRASFVGPRTLRIDPVTTRHRRRQRYRPRGGPDPGGRSRDRRHRLPSLGSAGPRGRRAPRAGYGRCPRPDRRPSEHRHRRSRARGLRVEPDLRPPGRRSHAGGDAAPRPSARGRRPGQGDRQDTQGRESHDPHRRIRHRRQRPGHRTRGPSDRIGGRYSPHGRGRVRPGGSRPRPAHSRSRSRNRGRQDRRQGLDRHRRVSAHERAMESSPSAT